MFEHSILGAYGYWALYALHVFFYKGEHHKQQFSERTLWWLQDVRSRQREVCILLQSLRDVGVKIV